MKNSLIANTGRVSALLISLACAAISVFPARGASISLTDTASVTGAASVSTNLGTTTPTSTTVLSDSKATAAPSDPNNYGSVSYSTSAQFGQTSLSLDATASCTYANALLCGPNAGGLYHYAEAQFGSGVNTANDLLYFSNFGGGTPLAEFQYLLTGTIGGAGGSSDGDLNFTLASNTVTLHLLTRPAANGDQPYYNGVTTANGSTMYYSGANLLTADPNLANTWDYTVWGTMIVPIIGGSLSLSNDITGSVDIVAGPQYTPTSWFSGTATAELFGLKVYNGAGTTQLNGVTVVSSSGYDYTQGPVSPEPATFGMIALGIAALVLRKR